MDAIDNFQEKRVAYRDDPTSIQKKNAHDDAFQRIENFRINRTNESVEFWGHITDPDERRDYAQALRVERHNLYKSDGNEDYVIALDMTLARPRHAFIIKDRSSLIQGAIDRDTWNWTIGAKKPDGT